MSNLSGCFHDYRSLSNVRGHVGSSISPPVSRRSASCNVARGQTQLPRKEALQLKMGCPAMDRSYKKFFFCFLKAWAHALLSRITFRCPLNAHISCLSAARIPVRAVFAVLGTSEFTLPLTVACFVLHCYLSPCPCCPEAFHNKDAVGDGISGRNRQCGHINDTNVCVC